MLVLILAVASVLIFFTIVLLLWIADRLESQTIRRKRLLMTAAKPLALLSISEAFDPVYSVLWDAPIAALERIASAGAGGVPPVKLHPIYEEAAAHFPEIYDGCSFLRWLQFLEQTRLISWHGHKVVLTPDGYAFLKFRFVTDAVVEV